MNIAIVYHYNPLDKISYGTPQSIESYLHNKHKVDKFLLDPTNCNFSSLIDNSNKYDVIIIFYAGPSISFDGELKKLKENTKTKIFLELGDEPQTYPHNQQRINYANAIFTPDLRCHKNYISRGYKSYWMTHWCDNSYFYYNTSITKQNTVITTCGQRPPYTDMLSKYLNNKFINKKINYEDNNTFYNSGTIVFQHARWDEITRRIFEGGGCKNAILANRISSETGIYDLFKEDEDICYYNDQMDCIKKVSRLLHDTEYREKLANNIYNKITNNHLTKHRCDLLLGALNE